MEQTMPLMRNGWSPEETELLWQEIRAAAESGAPLRGVFERMGQALGRKPNSVRNYYYMQLRGQGDASIRRAAPLRRLPMSRCTRCCEACCRPRAKDSPSAPA